MEVYDTRAPQPFESHVRVAMPPEPPSFAPVGIARARRLLGAFMDLAVVAEETLRYPGPLTVAGTPPDDSARCAHCGEVVGSGECCLDPIRAALRRVAEAGGPS